MRDFIDIDNILWNNVIMEYTFTEKMTAGMAQSKARGLQKMADIINIMTEMVRWRFPGFEGISGEADRFVPLGSWSTIIVYRE